MRATRHIPSSIAAASDAGAPRRDGDRPDGGRPDGGRPDSGRSDVPRAESAIRDGASRGGDVPGRDTTNRAAGPEGDLFGRRISQPTPGLLTDDIFPPGALLEFVSVDVLNCYINYVDLRAVITERDPDEEDRHISMSNRFYTHFHEFGTVIHVIATSGRYWWYFCYDIDASDCAIGRIDLAATSLAGMVEWVRRHRISHRYPVVEIDIANLRGWRSFQ